MMLKVLASIGAFAIVYSVLKEQKEQRKAVMVVEDHYYTKAAKAEIKRYVYRPWIVPLN